MGVPNATRLASSSAVTALGTWITLHTGAGGGTSGANEATGGGYVRRQTVWSDSGGTNRVGTAVNIPCGAGTYTEAGIFSASTAGTFVGSAVFGGGSVVVSGTGASIDVTMTVSA